MNTYSKKQSETVLRMEEKIISFVFANPNCRIFDVYSAIGISKRYAGQRLKILFEKNKIDRFLTYAKESGLQIFIFGPPNHVFPPVFVYPRKDKCAPKKIPSDFAGVIISPARQMGMFRDWSQVAFFGNGSAA